MKKKNRETSSSEFRQWDFCPRQWFFIRTVGRKRKNAASRKGMEFHRNMSGGVKEVQKAQRWFMAAAITGGIVCIFLLVSQF